MKRFVSGAVIILSAIIFIVGFAHEAMAENISISPPPIASPVLKDTQEMKHRLTMLTLEAPGMEMDGFGYDMVARNAKRGNSALNFQVGIFGLSGESDDGMGNITDITFMFLNLGLNFEYQLINTDTMSSIIFAGPAFNLISGTMDPDVTISGAMYGGMAGIQLGFKAGNFDIDPFFMATNMRGSMTMTAGGYSADVDIDPYTSTSYGLEILHTPTNITLSSIVQKAAGSESGSGDVETNIYQISWKQDF